VGENILIILPPPFFQSGEISHEGRLKDLKLKPLPLPTKDETSEVQRRLLGIFTCFLIFMIPSNCKLVSFFVISFSKQFKDYSQGRKLHLTLESSYFK